MGAEMNQDQTATGNLEPCPDCGHSCSIEAASCPSCGKPFSRTAPPNLGELDDRTYDRILMQSSMKLGMCLTLLGLIKVVEGVKAVTSIGDELLAINAIGFLASSVLTHFALKDRDEARKQRKGRTADIVFSASLCLLAVICGIIAFELF